MCTVTSVSGGVLPGRQRAAQPKRGSLENYLLKQRGAWVLGEAPSAQAACAASGAAGCAPDAQIRAEETQTRYD